MDKEITSHSHPDTPLGKGMDAWSAGLERVAASLPEGLLREQALKLSKALEEPREVGFRAVDELKLPRYLWRSVPVAEFMSDPEKYFDAVMSTKYYVYVKADDELEPILRGPMMSKHEILDVILSKIEPRDFQRYIIQISENYHNEYGGNAIVNLDQSMTLEFRKGNQGLISTGQATPDYIVKRASDADRFHYSFEDETLRRLIFSTIKEIPHDGRFYLPGYYEFHLVKKTDDGPIEPIFIDYRSNPAYLKKNIDSSVV